ncbi:tannase and feruloyl esterase [Penicillium soppii]|uniref:tannase and feruloyl esterase n=1 Tax=Penicillium soppii TaxID=69789 RepID=UPI002548BE97|nr:tannase and feruloyl esterase [Penicillium soppii]KAJ5861095.1 tannase and feruloyl esterase [Penicillium soppii]
MAGKAKKMSSPLKQPAERSFPIIASLTTAFPSPASSVPFHQSVRSTQFSNVTSQNSTDALNEWHRLLLVPRASRYDTSNLQPMPNSSNQSLFPERLS